MAYNPFNIFRRNQKTIFAVITVFIMFTFVLSSGLGGGADFFDWLPRWLGSTRAKGDALATLDGSGLYERDLTGRGDRGGGLQDQRRMANRFMAAAAGQAVQVLEDRADSLAGRMSDEAKQMMQPIRNQQMLLRQLAGQIRDPQMLANFARQIEAEMRPTLYAMVNAPNLRPDDKTVARAMLAAMSIRQSVGGPDLYFGNAPNRTYRDLIEFVLWQKKADQLGIRFTADDVKELIRREFYGERTPEMDVQIQKAMRENNSGFTPDAALKAIGEEFRVRAAQAAVLGPAFAHRDRGGVDKTYSGSPLFPTPFEAFEYFREEVSPTTYGVLPVPVANFVDQVPNPDEGDPKVRDELQRLYRQYSANEPNPGQENPGFRTPRRVTVGWLSIRGDEPYYVKLAEEALRESVPAAKAGMLLTVPVFGGSPAELAAAAAPVGSKDLLLEAAYQKLVRGHESALDTRWGRAGSFEPFGFVLDTSVVRPGVAAATAAGVAGDLLALGNPLSAAATAAGKVAGYEVRSRLKAGLPLVLGAVPGPGMFNTVMAGEAAYRSELPPPLPLAAHRPTLMTDLVAEQARRMAADDAEAFVRETRRWSANGKAKDRWWVEQYVKRFAARRGLTVHTTAEPRTEWTLEQDPALAELVKAQRESLRSARGMHGAAGGQGYVPFGDRFFYDASRGGRSPATGTFAAAFYPTDRPVSEQELKDKPQYLVWRTAEEPARPRAYEAAKADVILAWKEQKARELAKAKAEQIAEAIRKGDGGASEPVLLQNLEDAAGRLRAEFADPKAHARVEPFLFRGVAPLSSVPDPAGGKGLTDSLFPTLPGPVQAFNVPPSENLRYPTPEIRSTLLADRAKGPKHVAVLADAPKDTYLVTVLLKREVKSDTDFRLEVFGDAGRRSGGQTVMQAFREKAQEKTLKSVIGLLKQEFKYAETDEQKKKLDENEKRGGDV
jgi:hypothetical protein